MEMGPRAWSCSSRILRHSSNGTMSASARPRFMASHTRRVGVLHDLGRNQDVLRIWVGVLGHLRDQEPVLLVGGWTGLARGCRGPPPPPPAGGGPPRRPGPSA